MINKIKIMIKRETERKFIYIYIYEGFDTLYN